MKYLLFVWVFLLNELIYSQTTKKFYVPKKVIDKVKTEFIDLQVSSVSNLKEMDQYIIEGIISNEIGEIYISVSLTGETGSIVQASVRISKLDLFKKEDQEFIEKSTPNIPWKKFISKLDKKETLAGIAFLSFSELSGEREFILNTNSKKNIKPSVLYFDEYANLIRREKLKY